MFARLGVVPSSRGTFSHVGVPDFVGGAIFPVVSVVMFALDDVGVGKTPLIGGITTLPEGGGEASGSFTAGVQPV